MHRGSVIDAERVNPSDQPELRDRQFTEAAIEAARERASHREATPGRCANCGTQLGGASVYCDDDCRQDHEARETVMRRRGAR